MTDERKQEEGQKKIGEGVERDELSGGDRAGRGRRGGERGGGWKAVLEAAWVGGRRRDKRKDGG